MVTQALNGVPETRPESKNVRPLRLELAAIAVVFAVSTAAIARIMATPRAALLFEDGDSLLPVLVMRSIESGQPQEWVLSGVLFIPELVQFGILWLLRLGADATIVLNAIVNFVCLYLAFRFAAGTRRYAQKPLLGALIGFGSFILLTVFDNSSAYGTAELSSLLATATYYSATVIGIVVLIALARRAVESSGRSIAIYVWMLLVASLSSLSNPIFLWWATGPLVLILAILRWRDRDPRFLYAAAAVLGGSAVGYLGRGFFAAEIGRNAERYINIHMSTMSSMYYGELLDQTWRSPTGAMTIAVIAVQIGIAGFCSWRLRRRGMTGPFIVATAGWLIPLTVAILAIPLGTYAVRYFIPFFFAPAMALVVLPDAIDFRSLKLPLRWVTRVGAVAAVAGALITAGMLNMASNRSDGDRDCVTGWINDSGRVGAGQFWAVRYPKAYLQNPKQLVQVYPNLAPYDWLVNTDDAKGAEVTFLLADASSADFVLPDGVRMSDANVVRCGRYSIFDFGSHVTPLGVQASS